jgi:uncharacterized protein
MRRFAVCVSLAAVVASAGVEAQTAARRFLWMVQSEGAPPTYLMGSLHVLTPDYYPLSPRIEEAFKQSKVLIEEVDLDEMTDPSVLMPLLAKAVFTDGRTLDQVIAPDLYKKIADRAEKAGVPVVALQRMKPWMAAVSLTAPALKAAGFDTDLGIDKYFFDKAKASRMEHRALETIAYQFDRLDQMPPAVQEAMLQSVYSDLETQLASVKEIADAWSRGDTSAIERLLLRAFLETPELYERLLVERNRNWVEPVEACVKQKSACFVVVGAAHLVGPHSLVALLQRKGYVVEQQ